MKTIQWSKSLRFVMILILILGSNGCALGFEVGVEKQTRQVLEDAIDELGNWPGHWQSTLEGTLDKLGEIGAELAENVRREVQTLVAASTQLLQEASFCEIDFIGIRAKQHMQDILHEFFPDADPAVFTPVICTTNPTVVQSDQTYQVEFSGFDFTYFRDHGAFNADLVYGDNGESIQTNFGTVNVASNYHIVVDIQGFDYRPIVASRHPSLILKWNSGNIGGQSEIPINIVFTPIAQPPAVEPQPVDYQVTLFTGCVDSGGTDAHVLITLFGSQGNSEPIELITQNYDQRQACAVDTYLINSLDVGDLVQIKIEHDNCCDGPGWFLDKVVVSNRATGQSWEFVCNRWLAVNMEDHQTFRFIDLAGHCT